MELRSYLGLIAKRWWLILITIALGLAAGASTIRQEILTYRTTTVLFLNPNSSIKSLELFTPRDAAEQIAQTYTRYLGTEAFGSMVAQRLGQPYTTADVYGRLSGKLVLGTQFFELTATSTDPALARLLANTAAAVFITEDVALAGAEPDPFLRTLQVQHDLHTARIAALTDRLEQIGALPPAQQDTGVLLQLQNQITTEQQLLVQVASALVQAGASGKGVRRAPAAVIDAASLPTTPISSRGMQPIILGALIGLVAGISLTLLWESWESSYAIRRPQDVEQLGGLRSIGVISQFQGLGKRDQVLAVIEPMSQATEAFRSLRTTIEFSLQEQGGRALTITSPGPQEGKSVVSANLAAVMAQAGRRTVLVDGDLRRPSVHRMFRLGNVKNGLIQLLTDPLLTAAARTRGGSGTPNIAARRLVHDVLVQSETDSLWLLPSGGESGIASELLSSPAIDEVLSVLKEDFDCIIVDTPPCMVVTDGVILAAKTDATLIVVAAMKTRSETLVGAMAVLNQVGANVIGAVVNKVKPSELGPYYQYHYYRYQERQKVPA
ncbi:MAG: capsular exopolysaccharide family [Chloroflexi bacterium]|nr:capsular exopolysaccharide family [Chloroflexota bacterium]